MNDYEKDAVVSGLLKQLLPYISSDYLVMITAALENAWLAGYMSGVEDALIGQ